MDDESALIARCRDGDRDAFGVLMRLHEERVFALCVRTLRDREAALDTTQDVFITVFRKLDRFDGRSSFSTWLHRVTLNACYDRIRHDKRRSTHPLDERLDPADPVATDVVESAALRPELQDALAAIPPDFRAAVILVDVLGYGTEDAADVLGVARGTIKSRVFRGRRLLAEVLGNRSGPTGRPTGDTP